jgi:hypothetical protein
LFLFFNDFLNFYLPLGLSFFFEIAIEHGSINATIELIGMKSIAHAIGKLVKHLSIVELYLVFDEISHSIMLTQISELRQLFLIHRNCVTLCHLLLKLLIFLPLFVKLLKFTGNENFEVYWLFTFLLPFAHVVAHFFKIGLNLIHFLLMDIIDQIQQFPLHFLMFGINQIV